MSKSQNERYQMNKDREIAPFHPLFRDENVCRTRAEEYEKDPGRYRSIRPQNEQSSASTLTKDTASSTRMEIIIDLNKEEHSESRKQLTDDDLRSFRLPPDTYIVPARDAPIPLSEGSGLPPVFGNLVKLPPIWNPTPGFPVFLPLKPPSTSAERYELVREAETGHVLVIQKPAPSTRARQESGTPASDVAVILGYLSNGILMPVRTQVIKNVDSARPDTHIPMRSTGLSSRRVSTEGLPPPDVSSKPYSDTNTPLNLDQQVFFPLGRDEYPLSVSQDLADMKKLDPRPKLNPLAEYYQIGRLLSERGRHAEAAGIYLHCIEIAEARDFVVLICHAHECLGDSLYRAGYLSTAQICLRRALEFRDALASGDNLRSNKEQHKIITRHLLALTLFELGIDNVDQAVELLRENTDWLEKYFKAHPEQDNTQLSEENHLLARMLYKKGSFVQAALLEAMNIDRQRDKLGQYHPDVLAAQKRLGIDCYNSKRWKKGLSALRTYQDALVRLSQNGPPDRRAWAFAEASSAEIKQLIDGCEQEERGSDYKIKNADGYYRRAPDAAMSGTTRDDDDEALWLPAFENLLLFTSILMGEKGQPELKTEVSRDLRWETRQEREQPGGRHLLGVPNDGPTKREMSAPPIPQQGHQRGHFEGTPTYVPNERENDGLPLSQGEFDESVCEKPLRPRANSDTNIRSRPSIGNIYSTSEHDSSDQWFESLSTDAHALLNYKNPHARVKIAILDTGIDGTHPAFTEEKRIKGYRSWVDPVAESKTRSSGFQASVLQDLCVDENGHGTHAADLLLRVDPLASLYVARVVQGNTPKPEHVAEAIRFATDEWNVDIISMSLGFRRQHEGIDSAIRHATDSGVLIFAAASNDGINKENGIAFPARLSNVICVNSANFYGRTSDFNPNPSGLEDYFSFLGENVLSAWTGQQPGCRSMFSFPSIVIGYDDTTSTKEPPAAATQSNEATAKRASGTSVATPIAAGTAALFLEFMRQRAAAEPKRADLAKAAEYLKRTKGMRLVLRSIAQKKSGDVIYQYIAPWFLLNKEKYKSMIKAQMDICTALSVEYDLE